MPIQTQFDFGANAATNREQSSQRRDDSLERVEKNASEDWIDTAKETLREYLRTHQWFFVDDFWSDTGLEKPREARALGAVVKWAAKKKLMRKSGSFRKSVRSNMTEKPVWESLIQFSSHHK